MRFSHNVRTIMGLVFFLTSLTSFFQIASAQEEQSIKNIGKKYPRIFFESLSFDFGQVSRKQGKIKKVFKLYNKGVADLIITGISASCSCVFTSLSVDKINNRHLKKNADSSEWPKVIPPAGSARLEVVLDLGHPSIKIGKVFREACINSNDPIHSEVKIKLQAEVLD